MPVVAVTHGYPGLSGWSMGGEVSLHRTLVALGQPVTVLTRTPKPYTFDGIHVKPLTMTDVLDPNADPTPLVWQLAQANATCVIAQNELSLPAVKAARALGIPSIVGVHTPPRYGRGIAEAVRTADAAIYNTATSAQEWGEPDALVIHPPISPLPPKPTTLPQGDAYTILSNLANKGVNPVLELAARMPEQRFIIVRSPAEPTHGLEGFDSIASTLPNVEVMPRVAPAEVAERYLSQTRILLAPSRYETYGMSTIEAAGYGIPTVHVDTPHVREGIGEAAHLIPPLNLDGLERGIAAIEADYAAWSRKARARAEQIDARQTAEMTAWAEWLPTVTPLTDRARSRRAATIRRR